MRAWASTWLGQRHGPGMRPGCGLRLKGDDTYTIPVGRPGSVRDNYNGVLAGFC